MTINELSSYLQDLIDSGEGDKEVRIMSQATWPFENGMAGICLRSQIDPEKDEHFEYDEPDSDDAGDHAEDCGCEACCAEDSDTKDCLFIVEGSQLCNGNKNAWDACRR